MTFEIQRYGNGIMSAVPRSPVIVSSIAKTEGEGMGDSIVCDANAYQVRERGK